MLQSIFASGSMRAKLFLKKKLCKSIIVQLLLHAAESWTVYAKHLRLLQGFHRKNVRMLSHPTTLGPWLSAEELERKLGWRVASSRPAGGIKDLWDSGLLKLLTTLDLDLRDTFNKSTWYNTSYSTSGSGRTQAHSGSLLGNRQAECSYQSAPIFLTAASGCRRSKIALTDKCTEAFISWPDETSIFT
jgi:hypothetical protein